MKKLQNLKKILTDHNVTKMPKEVSHHKNVIITTIILSTGILDLLSFSIKGAQYALTQEMRILAFIFIILYFLKSVIASSVQAFTDDQKTRFASEQDSYIIENVSNISNIVRGKAFKQDDNYLIQMTNAEIIICLKDYISYVWSFWQNIPFAISNSITGISMAIGILVTEFLQSKNIQETFIFSIILFSCIIIFVILYLKRQTVRKRFRNSNKELRKQEEVLFNDIKNVEPLLRNEFYFRIDLLIKNLQNKRMNEKKEVFSLNLLQILKTLVLGSFMISIVLLKLHYAGGISKLDIIIMTDIFAVSSVYSTILDKIANFLRYLEEINNTLKEAENYKIEVDTIMEIFNYEINKRIITENIEKITVTPFNFSYSSPISVYELVNRKPFELNKGYTYVAHGPTGCGKSTLMHLLAGKLQIEETPISYGDNKRAYIGSIMHEADCLLGTNSILDEITFGGEIITTKLVEILKGVNIYQAVLSNLGLHKDDNARVLEYLAKTNFRNYSSGQRQRIEIAKVLYNMTQDHQILIFDEATRALDDETAKDVIKFVSEYSQKDTKRIVLFVSHQVELTRQFVNGEIIFSRGDFPKYEISLKKY